MYEEILKKLTSINDRLEAIHRAMESNRKIEIGDLAKALYPHLKILSLYLERHNEPH